MTQVKVGDVAPEFTAISQAGDPVSLADYRSRSTVVLFFYPRDDSLICTKEACAFRDAYEDFVRAGAAVLGVSGDSEASHQAFATQQHLPFTLLSDGEGTLRRLFGVPKTLGLFPGRVTYVIDRTGIVRHIFNSQFSAGRHVTEALEIVRQLTDA